MTATAPMKDTTARTSALDRDLAMRLAAGEYDRIAQVLRRLSPDDWSRSTDCPGWDVRALATHVLGMAEMAASVRESIRQLRAATRRGGVLIDALTALQVDERRSLSPAEVVERLSAVAPRAVRGRRRTPGFVRRRPMPQRQQVGGELEAWTFGYLVDTILTRDTWMHRVDLAHATGQPMELTHGHDGVLVADIASEWAQRHGQPYTLRLAGPAGGEWSRPGDGPVVEMDAVEFCRALSGRAAADGLLAHAVPF
ncbi:MAG: maleylpyruvate isomerase family mycothiol-dependent enzyme [Actinomycetes bacterium]